jgi:hypothetical protein
VIYVRAVGGGFRGRPELGPWRLQCGEEGEGLRAFCGCFTSFDVKACLSPGKLGSFGGFRPPRCLIPFGWLLPEVLFRVFLPGFAKRLWNRGCGGCFRHRCSRVSHPVCVSSFR